MKREREKERGLGEGSKKEERKGKEETGNRRRVKG